MYTPPPPTHPHPHTHTHSSGKKGTQNKSKIEIRNKSYLSGPVTFSLAGTIFLTKVRGNSYSCFLGKINTNYRVNFS